MQNKALLFGIIGFIAGGLLVSVAATSFDKPDKPTTSTSTSQSTAPANDMAMMASSLSGKQGDDYDKAFIADMIKHHEGAVAMAKLSASRAKHNEIKSLSDDIIAAQQKEIGQMKQWQIDWGYGSPSKAGTVNGMDGMTHSN